MDSPVHIQTLHEIIFNPRLNQEELHYWDTDTVIRHVLHFLDERTLVRVTQAHMGFLNEYSLEEILEEKRRDHCPICLGEDVTSDSIIMECCSTRYHTECIDQCDTCPTCRKLRPSGGWFGFQSWVSYFKWDRWRGRIDRILQKDPVRAIVPLMQALHGRHSDKLKYDAVLELLNLVPQYSVRMGEPDVRGILLDLIAEDDRVNSSEATERLFHRLQESAWLLLTLIDIFVEDGRLNSGEATTGLLHRLQEADGLLFRRLYEIQEDKMPGSSFAWLRAMLHGDRSHIIVALHIIRSGGDAAFDPFADDIVSLFNHSDPRVRAEALTAVECLEIPPIGEYMSSLVALLITGGTDEVKLAAAWALESISESPEDEIIFAIVEAGAIPPLVTMLTSGGSDEVKVTAARALYKLANSYKYFLHYNFPFNDNNIVATTQAGVIPPLIAMLSTGTAEIKIYAAWLLGSRSSNNDYRVQVALAGAIPHLVLMLSEGDTSESNESACRALWRLSMGNNENKASIAQAGAIPYLIAFVSGFDYSCVRDATNVLLELTTNANDNYRVEIVREGAIPPLVAMLRPGFGNINTDNENTQVLAMKVLQNLCNNNDNQVAIIQEGAIPYLVEIKIHNLTTGAFAVATETLRILAIEHSS